MSLSAIDQSLSPKAPRRAGPVLLIVGMIVMLAGAAYGLIESRRTETVIIAVRAIPFGQQITADDLGTVELPLHRPSQFAGIADPNAVVGKWAARTIGSDDQIKPAMLLAQPPDQPVYPSGQQLSRNMVPMPFSTKTIGPLSVHDVVNIGFNDPTGDPQLCLNTLAAVNGSDARPSAGAAPQTSALDGPAKGRPYACRFMQRVKVLDLNDGEGLAYLEVTPYQAHAIWAVQAAGLQLWGERYGATSDALPALDRLDAAQIVAPRLTAAISDTAALLPAAAGMPPSEVSAAAGANSTTTVPGANSAIPGQPAPTTVPAGAAK